MKKSVSKKKSANVMKMAVYKMEIFNEIEILRLKTAAILKTATDALTLLSERMDKIENINKGTEDALALLGQSVDGIGKDAKVEVLHREGDIKRIEEGIERKTAALERRVVSLELKMANLRES